MVGAVHQQHRLTVGQELGEFVLEGGQTAHQLLGVLGQRGAVAVAGHQVLGPHAGPVRGGPHERGLLYGGRDTPPHHRVTQSGLVEDLRHLGHVTEHVGQVADLHHAPEGASPDDALLQVPHDGLAGDEELVHEDVPGSHGDPAGGGERPEPVLVLGADLQVVVDDGQLTVEQEM